MHRSKRGCKPPTMPPLTAAFICLCDPAAYEGFTAKGQGEAAFGGSSKESLSVGLVADCCARETAEVMTNGPRGDLSSFSLS
jgi:hypothetical protein